MIKFCFQKQFKLYNRRRLKEFLNLLFIDEGFSAHRIDIIFCSDEYLLKINQEFLNHDFYTDIVTFGESESDKSITGELYISGDRVMDNANNLNQDFQRELHRVIFHGCLHLCGYLDKSSKEIAIMRKMEDYYLNKYFNVPHNTVSG